MQLSKNVWLVQVRSRKVAVHTFLGLAQANVKGEGKGKEDQLYLDVKDELEETNKENAA